MNARMIPTTNGHFHNGHFAECVGKRITVEESLGEIPFDETSIDSSDDNTEKSECPFSSAFDFLHGACNLFAAALHERKGYDVFEIVRSSGGSIHWYASAEYRGRPVYIDVRGVTTDQSEFFREFSYEMSMPYCIEQRKGDELLCGEKWEKTGIAFASQVISISNGVYDI